MGLPPADAGLDFGDAMPLPEDDIQGDMFSDHLDDEERLHQNLSQLMEDDEDDHGLLPALHHDDENPIDIFEACDVGALPGDLCRTVCGCNKKEVH